jgi:RNA polymerase sigma-70 factor (ECF subfamily)
MEAVRSLFEREAGRVFQLAYRLVGNREAALDATQETFLRAVGHAAELDPARNLTGWIMRIARNVCIDGLRSKRSAGPHVSVEAAGEAVRPVDRDTGADRRVVAEERRARVEVALASLSAEHRDILVLRDVMDLSYEEIAETLSIPAGTVMSRLHRARVAMRNALGGDPHAL